MAGDTKQTSGTDAGDAKPSCVGLLLVGLPALLAAVVYASFAVIEPWDDGACLLRPARSDRPLPAEEAKLREFARGYHVVPYGLSWVVNGFLDDVGVVPREWRLPEALLPVAGLPCRGPLRLPDGDGARDDEALATALRTSPLWVGELLLPPEQLVALHLPLFVPAAVALVGATIRIVVATLSERKKSRNGVRQCSMKQ